MRLVIFWDDPDPYRLPDALADTVGSFMVPCAAHPGVRYPTAAEFADRAVAAGLLVRGKAPGLGGFTEVEIGDEVLHYRGDAT